jgi:hypothetical protein
MSLRDFGGGYKEDDPNPEDKRNRKLSQWLAQQEQTTVYWDRKRSYGHGTFSVSTDTTPDLVIQSASNNFAVEVKRETDSTEIYNSLWQTVGYWRDIVDGKATYTVNGKELQIEGVLIATGNSPNGHLFSSKNKTDPRRTERSSESDVEGVNYPSNEHAASQVFVRCLYRAARKEYERGSLSGGAGIGALYSTALEGDKPGVKTTKPAAFHLAPGRDHGKVQNWDYIPFFKQNNE